MDLCFCKCSRRKIVYWKNDDGEITGLDNIKRLLEEIPNKIQTRLGIICDVNLIESENLKHIEILVKKYDVPISFQGKYYFRSGSTNILLQGTELSNFLLRKTGKTWDDVVEPRATLGDIEISAIESFKKGAILS